MPAAARSDYERIDELDRYDEEMLDEREYASMSAGARRAAEDELATRAPAQREHGSQNSFKSMALAAYAIQQTALYLRFPSGFPTPPHVPTFGDIPF